MSKRQKYYFILLFIFINLAAFGQEWRFQKSNQLLVSKSPYTKISMSISKGIIDLKDTLWIKISVMNSSERSLLVSPSTIDIINSFKIIKEPLENNYIWYSLSADVEIREVAQEPDKITYSLLTPGDSAIYYRYLMPDTIKVDTVLSHMRSGMGAVLNVDCDVTVWNPPEEILDKYRGIHGMNVIADFNDQKDIQCSKLLYHLGPIRVGILRSN